MTQPGDKVILEGVPRILLHGLPKEDQAAIRAAIGTEVVFRGLRLRGRGEAEVEFRDKDGAIHTIWIGVWWLRSLDGGHYA